MASMESGTLDKVWEIKVLKKVREAEARRLLEMAAKQVQPIMKKRHWKVKILSEFSPANPNLLGLNVGGGQHVKIRLRPHGRDGDFFPYDHILGTLLHELTHNEHGPHDAKFYKLLDEITKDCEELMMKGILGSGQGFEGGLGHKLGGHSRNIPITTVREAAAIAAEKRARGTQLMPAGPRRLGGDHVIMSALSPIQAAAMAAERRLRDDLWCAGSSAGSVNANAEVVKEELQVLRTPDEGKGIAKITPTMASASLPERLFTPNGSRSLDKGHHIALPASIGLISERENRGGAGTGVIHSLGSPEELPGSHGRFQASGSASCVREEGRDECGQNPLSAEKETRKRSHREESPDELDPWACPACTLVNPPIALMCDACGHLQPRNWRKSDQQTWACRQCTLENLMIIDRCSACDTWRFSYGEPVASQSPYVGT